MRTKPPRDFARQLFSSRRSAAAIPDTERNSARRTRIEEFTRSHIFETSHDYLQSEIDDDFAALFDYFVVGSDQVWNPTAGLSNTLRFLEFAHPQQRVAYAASFGLSSLPAHSLAHYHAALSEIARLSVRENRAAEIVWELVGREAKIVLDPTMLVANSRWNELAVSPSSLPRGGYVAKFFLGSGAEMERLSPVTQYARTNGLDMVDLSWDLRDSGPAHLSDSGRLYDLEALGPLEFIGAIKASSLLLTDSFHAAVFATIFRVPYLLRGRGGMNSRFDTLLNKSGLPMPKWGTLKELEASIDIDWDSVHQNLARERALSLDYLRTALSLPADP